MIFTLYDRVRPKNGRRKWMRVAYVRVSTEEQNEERQKEALKKFNIEKWFEEKVSAKDADRQQLQLMLDFVREGDIVYVHDLSRLARSTFDLLTISKILQKKGVDLVSNKENVDTTTPAGRLMFTLIGAIAEFERDVILERQREGIALAKKAGKYKGRKKKKIEGIEDYYDLYMTRKMTKVQIMNELHISRTVLDRYFAEFNATRGFVSEVPNPIVYPETWKNDYELLRKRECTHLDLMKKYRWTPNCYYTILGVYEESIGISETF